MIISRLRWASVPAMAFLLACGCRRDASPPADTSRPGPDYRRMIERARNRQSDARNTEMLLAGIQRFQSDLGRFPTGLVELVSRGYIPVLPAPPRGMAYSYDRVLGNVMLVRIPHNEQAP